MSIRKRPHKNGVRYQVQYRDPTGRQRSKQFSTKREATAFESEQRIMLRRGEWLDPKLKEFPFDEWAKVWMESDPGKRDSSRARDEIVVRLHLVPVFRNQPLGHITPMNVQALVNAWTETLSAQTVHRQYRTLAAIMRSALNNDLIMKSPCRAIRLPKIERKPVRIVTPDELERIAEHMGRYAPMAYIGCVLGLRWGEVAGLRVQDLDITTHRLHVVQQVTRDLTGGATISQPKTPTSVRTIAIPPELADMLIHHIEAGSLANAAPDALLFGDERGGPMRYSNWRSRCWAPACKAAEMEGLGFHDLRRANATAMVAAGVDIKTAQRRLGHADPRMTLAVYAQATDKGDEAAAVGLGEMFLSRRRHRERSDDLGVDIPGP